MRCAAVFVALAALVLAARAERTVTTLDTGWTADGAAVALPHTWNAVDASDGVRSEDDWNIRNSTCALSYARKCVTYRRALPGAKPGRRYFVRFPGASVKATVRVNGRELGRHVGAFAAFCFEATAAMKSEGNILEIDVDNRFDPDVQPIHADFSVYGGLHRIPELIETDPVCIDPVTDGANGLVVDADPKTGRVRVSVAVLDGTNEVQEFAFPNPKLWSPESPALYAVDVTVRQNGSVDTVRQTFGFRTAEIRPDGFYLNGVRRKIRGVCRHQDREGRGWGRSREDEADDVRWIKRMGADGVRTAHYPDSAAFYDLCDEQGLLVYTELPFVNGITFSEQARANDLMMAREMVAQHRNHPCIFAWGVFNEIYMIPMQQKPEPRLAEVAARLKALDPSRPTIGALCIQDKPELNRVPDHLGFNLYPYWYGPDDRTMFSCLTNAFANTGVKSACVSEYGAGGCVSQHADPTARPDSPRSAFHPEEYQAYVHAMSYPDILKDGRIWGSFLWQMFDHAADIRREGSKFGLNDKGLVTWDRMVAKDAYYFYKANWNPEPELHLVGANRTVSEDPCTTVLAFSNVGPVTLFVNGARRGVMEPDATRTVMWKDVPLCKGLNEIEIRGGDFRKTARWTYEPKPASAQWKAKWIAPSRITRPDVDFGGAQWVSATGGVFRAEFTLDRVPAGPSEGVAIGTGSGCYVKVNGRSFVAPCGFTRDGSRLCRGDVARFLRPGKNVVEAKVENPNAAFPPSMLLAFLAEGRPFFVSGADWRNAAGESVRVEGAPRAVAWDGNFDYSVEVASPAFEKRFAVKGPVAAATLRIAAAGFYEAQLDGVKIGDKVLDPPPTDYRRRILYSEYPVALTPGEHALTILLGHSWYDMRTCATWNFDIAPWRNAPRTIAELTIRYADGSVETVGTDREWRQVKSPVAYDDIREGEIVGAYDPRMPDLESRWVHPEVVPAPCDKLVRAELPGSKKVRAIAPEKIVKTGEDRWTVVFPENFAGWTRFTFRGAQKGDVITLRYDEHIGKDYAPTDGRVLDCFFYRSGSSGILPGGACQQDRIVASGAAEETFEPRFVYHGFQYVHLFGLRTEPKLADIVGYEVRTAFEKTGSFECSDTNVNRLVALADASYRSNFVNGFPTDCPHREKLGWTADAALASHFAQYLYDNTAAYRKWVTDICDAQRHDGALPGIVPTGGWGFALYNGASWDYAIAEVPWTVYWHRGDRRILEDAFPALLQYVKYQAKRCPSGLIDWSIMEDWHPMKTKTEPPYMCTAYFARAAGIAVRMAELLGRADDMAFCAAAEARSRAAFRKAFARGNGVYGPGGQTAQSVALNFGLVPEDELPAARARLLDAFRATDDHIDVGIQGFANIFPALSEMGRTDLAHRVLTRDGNPSPMDWIRGGETTLGDYIHANAGSRNHVMYGTYVAWAFKYLAGIAPAEPGYARVRIAPRPIPALSYVKAMTRTPKGDVSSEWTVADGVFTLEVTVPKGVPTEVCLPDGSSRTFVGGTRSFTCSP